MKTSLHVTAFLFAAGLPCAAVVELSGVPLPAAFSSLSAFSGFVASLTLLIAFGDYARSSQLAARTARTALTPARTAVYPLAA